MFLNVPLWPGVPSTGSPGPLALPAPCVAISVGEAPRAITAKSAYARRTEMDLGFIEADEIANFNVLDEDPYAVAPMHLKDIKRWGTVFEGRKFSIQP